MPFTPPFADADAWLPLWYFRFHLIIFIIIDYWLFHFIIFIDTPLLITFSFSLFAFIMMPLIYFIDAISLFSSTAFISSHIDTILLLRHIDYFFHFHFIIIFAIAFRYFRLIISLIDFHAFIFIIDISPFSLIFIDYFLSFSFLFAFFFRIIRCWCLAAATPFRHCFRFHFFDRLFLTLISLLFHFITDYHFRFFISLLIIYFASTFSH
jgi:hypothetical protein